ncbi:hypothetical protein [Streptomyces sp. NPDC088358]|uniref:hypothetical protein n=1 Tax=Streptomyces sp. NPDC088358 TaxID=3365857 RepID=UPI003800B660
MDLATPPADVTGTASGSDHAPQVLMGHGGGTNKKAPGMVRRAHRLVTKAVSTSSPSTRPATAADRAPRSTDSESPQLQQAMAAGELVGPIVVCYNARRSKRAVPE